MSIYKTVAKGSLYGISCVNVFHYETFVPSVSGTEQDDINERWIALILPKLIAVQSINYRWNCVSTSIVGPGSAQIYDEILASGNDGLVDEHSLPANKCYRASYYTAFMGPSGRGRKHFSGIPEPWEDDNAIVQEIGGDNPAVELGNLQTVLVGALAGGAGGGSFLPVVYSTFLGTVDTVIKVVCSPQVSTMRSRTPSRC